MTFEEAKNQLEELIQDRKSFICGGDDEIYKKDLEALKKALELFDKQIPRKPIKKLRGRITARTATAKKWKRYLLNVLGTAVIAVRL